MSNKEKGNGKKEINIKATLIGVRERCEKIEKIKALKEQHLQNENEKPSIGIRLIYNITKKQNQKLLVDLEKAFESKLAVNIDLQKQFIKPPYLTPQIVAHKTTKILNQI
jgi:hypothetical protein